MKHLLLLPILLLLTASVLPTTIATPEPSVGPLSIGPTNFEARMSGTQENPPVATTGHGFFTATLNADETMLTFSVTIIGMDVSTIFQAHIHVGRAGINGPVILFLFNVATQGTWTNPVTGTLTQANLIPRPAQGINNFTDFVSKLKAGETYANAHTPPHPGGEVRGQIGLSVGIDVKPGSDPNPVNLRSTGVIPVAIHTTNMFDATSVDPSTVRFGRFGTEATIFSGPASFAFEDVDGDGDIDMILHFRTIDTRLQAGDSHATLTGKTFSGGFIVGTDQVRAFNPGDINVDGTVDIVDAFLLLDAFSSTPGSPNWNLFADIDMNGTVDLLDATELSNHLGLVY